ncbi:MAG: DUF3489 domain-containing protein [Rhodospirillales bacterium]|nr:DUF3489 domain-containing protein [Rhodospirillales bacterium]
MTSTSRTDPKAADCKPARCKSAPRKKTRRQQLCKLLSRRSGVTIAQLQKAFGWQPHTAHAAISTLRKAGHHIARSKACVYRIVREG